MMTATRGRCTPEYHVETASYLGSFSSSCVRVAWRVFNVTSSSVVFFYPTPARRWPSSVNNRRHCPTTGSRARPRRRCGRHRPDRPGPTGAQNHRGDGGRGAAATAADRSAVAATARCARSQHATTAWAAPHPPAAAETAPSRRAASVSAHKGAAAERGAAPPRVLPHRRVPQLKGHQAAVAPPPVGGSRARPAAPPADPLARGGAGADACRARRPAPPVGGPARKIALTASPTAQHEPPWRRKESFPRRRGVRPPPRNAEGRIRHRRRRGRVPKGQQRCPWLRMCRATVARDAGPDLADQV